MSTGRLIVQLGFAAYILFTLLPDSSTQMVTFPWVLLWQVGLLCFAIAGLLNLWRRENPFYLLGSGFDWAIGSGLVTLCLSTMFSRFPNQGMWYSLTAFGYFTALYVTNNFLHVASSPAISPPPMVREKLFKIIRFQGLLGFAVIIVSLFLWITQSWLPQLTNFAKLNQWGLNLSYDFSDLQSRNWAPMGHQNYVAGFLILVLPIFASLAIAQRGMWRSLWLTAIGLGLIDLYTTSSRGGFLGLGAIVLYGIIVAFFRNRSHRGLVALGGGGAIALVAFLISTNNRLRSLISGLISSFANPTQGSGELLFRAIAADVGWRIGLEHWLFGAGAGSAVMLYQQYRPQWAGREAELLFQLHSTPVHLWAELGIGAVITFVFLLAAIISLFIKLHKSRSWQASLQDQAIAYGLFGSLIGYGMLAITDYQLDVPAISGSLVIIFACLAYLGQVHTRELISLGHQKQPRLWLAVTATVYLVAAIAWLVPVNIAWQASSIGFIYLSTVRVDLATAKPEFLSEAIAAVDKFQDRLKFAHQLAPWEPYYSYQLGWNLADLAGDYPNLPQSSAWQKEGLTWIKTALASNPYNEAGYNAAAWLSLRETETSAAQAAETYFRRGLELVPNKRSLSFGLGISLLRQGKQAEAIAAMTTEVINDPIFITSPIWKDALYQSIYLQVLANLETSYRGNPQKTLNFAALQWWNGNPNVVNELQQTGNPTAVLLAKAIANDTNALQSVKQNPQTPLEMVISAWLNPNLRDKLLERAYVFATSSLPDERSAAIVKAMSDRMAQSPNFDAWFRLPVPANSPLVITYRRARLGFGVVSRHGDGVVPLDFFNVRERAEISLFLKDLFS
ncbi:MULTISPECIES: O-antigen ligase family protein [Pseudanabaena]|uniref:O-antigen ligase family protein n=1 Tax=Pseudanabaena TaxID=1152 RepID=UPI0024792B4F|nr:MULTISPECIES: O-antigen ligase family protein [Pseudanabaena]MEA5485389.1 O-antigen ligase family protein [Pseudanabaena sp. CCNP1317]WGS73608.1 O-antigen ligase family protein [Pseudanabaena galeata CCNP1313]